MATGSWTATIRTAPRTRRATCTRRARPAGAAGGGAGGAATTSTTWCALSLPVAAEHTAAWLTGAAGCADLRDRRNPRRDGPRLPPQAAERRRPRRPAGRCSGRAHGRPGDTDGACRRARGAGGRPVRRRGSGRRRPGPGQALSAIICSRADVCGNAKCCFRFLLRTKQARERPGCVSLDLLDRSVEPGGGAIRRDGVLQLRRSLLLRRQPSRHSPAPHPHCAANDGRASRCDEQEQRQPVLGPPTFRPESGGRGRRRGGRRRRRRRRRVRLILPRAIGVRPSALTDMTSQALS